MDRNLKNESSITESFQKFDHIIERPLQGITPYHVLGDLILPAPSTCGLDGAHQKLAFSLMLHLQQLQRRDLSSKLDECENKEEC
jgi:hypothetical protein